MNNEQASCNPMKYDCAMVKDLLPLYHDGVCSAASGKIVETHVLECADCRKELLQLKDDVVDLRLQQERQDVVAQHATHVKKDVRRKSVTIGAVMSAIFALPILVCLIVNLATSHALDWFFIVLTSLSVVASVTIVPILAPRRKFLWTAGGFVTSLHLLLMTVCLYVNGDWFWLVSMSVLFGLTLFGLPFLLFQIPKTRAGRHKGLLVMLVNTGMLYLLLFVIGGYAAGRYVDAATYWRCAMLIPLVCLPLPWALFGVFRYLPMTKRGKTGMCLILCGAFTAVCNDLIQTIVDGGASFFFRLRNVDFMHWTLENVNDNVNLIICAACIVLGLFFLLIQGKRKPAVDPQRADYK